MALEDQALSALAPSSKQKRASKPKVRTGCTTCKCTRTGRICDGYGTPKSTALFRALAPAPAIDDTREPHALEFFFVKTAPQLAGYFGGAFFQGSVLQLSLAEPAIRQAIAAIGILHESTATGKWASKGNSPPNVHIQLYNRSIRTIINKVVAGPNASPVIATTNVLFTCFEIFQGNVAAAATHITAGINLLQAWRAKHGGPITAWGRRYTSFESHFMETEIAPLLSLFNINAVECAGGSRSKFLLNPVDERGVLLLATRFETLAEARIGLIDMITDATCICDGLDDGRIHRPLTDIDAVVLSQSVQRNLERWQANVDELIRRQKHTWDRKEQQVADVISIIRLATKFGVRAYEAEAECEWDAHRAEYEDLIRSADAIISDRVRFPDDLSRTINLDFGMIFPLHAVAWKCRWPRLRRQGLDLLQRIPKREWLFEAGHYHAIFTRIMEIEEAECGLPLGVRPGDDWLPPEHVRIRDFLVAAQATPPGEIPTYAVTFFSKPHGPDGPLESFTEQMRLGSSQGVKAAVPTNMIGRRLERGSCPH
ncbi:uncharacterized protein N7482_004411 [Penicillium canariense]|uniref:Zn(2)-C6 fungal-type domain-containing protein n=1 Tax=Penicillium canariense TaxID=189055 RepID=A0A9W9IAC0_9EURO|nr:uncharacterized protein N7482_004411 [Penicillium canariense]KAJ5168817.1 hypothetical protein N7482_004411 [Penicillium canariense]